MEAHNYNNQTAARVHNSKVPVLLCLATETQYWISPPRPTTSLFNWLGGCQGHTAFQPSTNAAIAKAQLRHSSAMVHQKHSTGSTGHLTVLEGELRRQRDLPTWRLPFILERSVCRLSLLLFESRARTTLSLWCSLTPATIIAISCASYPTSGSSTKHID